MWMQCFFITAKPSYWTGCSACITSSQKYEDGVKINSEKIKLFVVTKQNNISANIRIDGDRLLKRYVSQTCDERERLRAKQVKPKKQEEQFWKWTNYYVIEIWNWI